MEYSKEGLHWPQQVVKISTLSLFAFVLTKSCFEFFEVTWGTGLWLGEFSKKWGLAFFAFVFFCLFLFLGTALFLFDSKVKFSITQRLVSFRVRLRVFRWVLIAIFFLLPIWFLQFTPWGVVFQGFYFRVLLWIFSIFFTTIFLGAGTRLFGWLEFLSALIISTSLLSISFSMIDVIDYPFSLHWSEGNRLWDYSLLFGHALYDYPPNKEIYSLTDVGRQLVGGLPFIFPGVTIFVERLWVGLTDIFPYTLLGLVAFRTDFKDKKTWLLLALFTFLFLKQGPIHPPLVLCAVLVALTWRSPLWIGVPLIFITGYLAETSRYTWVFAPAIWIGMLEFSSAKLHEGNLQSSTWWRTIVLAVSGAVGGYYGSTLLKWVQAVFAGGGPSSIAGEGAVTASFVSSALTGQSLLWYRLFPNPTYGNGTGIVLGLLIAVGPLISILLYLTVAKKWVLNFWQKLALVLPSLAFLVVGLIISTKIGGGGDLHNLDMFLIGVLFAAVIAWENGGRQWLGKIDTHPVWVKGILVLLLVIPGIQPLSALRTFRYDGDRTWLVTLTGVSDEKFLDLLPVPTDVNDILQTIRQEVDAKKSQGEVLFMDQRQLLTFGYVKNVPLVPEYEKKVLMEQAMAENTEYYRKFYSDLASHRFTLIVTDPLRRPIKDSEAPFGEENNYWVDWVVKPTLCYYWPIETFTDVQIELLVPRTDDVNCSSKLPFDIGTQN